MQADMQLNKINALDKNLIPLYSNSSENNSGVVAKDIYNAENKPISANLNNSRETCKGNNVKQDRLQENVGDGLKKNFKAAKSLSPRQVYRNNNVSPARSLPIISPCNAFPPTMSPRNVTLAIMSPLYDNLPTEPPCNEAAGMSFYNASLSSASPTENGCFTTWNKYVGKQISKRFFSNKKGIPNQTSKSIDEFIKSLEKNHISFTNDNFLGGGQYGTAYRFGKYVIKVPVNINGDLVDWHSGWNRSANPERASRYLNAANQDESFSRVANINFKGQNIKALVTKYIKGSALKGDEEINVALRLLQERGLHMHDFYVDGNILKAKDGKLYFIDADQLVIGPDKRVERTPSLATKDLEDMLALGLSIDYIQAKQNNDQNKINEINYMSQFFKEITGIAVKK